MQGARFVQITESERGDRLASGLLKAITGDANIAARFMWAEWHEFKPACKIWIDTNYKPRIKGDDDAMWRRVKLIPFKVKLPEVLDADEHFFENKLKPELPGILRWAVIGIGKWMEKGLGRTAAVVKATDEYRYEEDYFARFLSESCIEVKGAKFPKGQLYQAFADWYLENIADTPLSKINFSRMMQEKGFKEGRTNRSRIWIGIKLKDECWAKSDKKARWRKR